MVFQDQGYTSIDLLDAHEIEIIFMALGDAVLILSAASVNSTSEEAQVPYGLFELHCNCFALPHILILAALHTHAMLLHWGVA